MAGETLVELCAGSAAVSLRYLDSKGRPPLAWQGGKRGYADAILGAMGLAPGGGAGGDVLLVEPGPWGEAWDLWRTREGRADTIARLRAWAEEDPRTLWQRLRAAPPPPDPAERVATWAALQFWSFGRKPVRGEEGRWRSHGFNAVEAYRSTYRAGEIGTKADGSKFSYAARDRRLPDVIAALQALPDLSRVHVLRCSALEVPTIRGARYFIDPPYESTTCAYGHGLPRADVLALAQRLDAGGAALVAVSEAEALPLPGWRAQELGGPSGFGRTWSKQRREVLTVSRRPARAACGPKPARRR